MAKDEKRTVTPRLRFPEFREMKGWMVRALALLLSRPPEYGINAASVPFSETLPTYLRITDIDDEGCFISESKVSVDADIDEDNYVSDGDLVLARTGASVGKSYRYRECDGRLVFAGFLIRIRPNPKKLMPTLLASYLATRQYWDWVRMTSARSGQPGINGKEYSVLPIPLPISDLDEYGLSEQRKIADCLTSLDELIAAQGRKVDGLKTHKKGLMQQLFPREGETLPRRRFPEFRNTPEWEPYPFEEFVATSFYGTSRSTSANGRYPVLRMGNMVGGGIEFSNLAYIDLDRKEFELIRLQNGDILLNRTNSLDLVGKISIFTLESECITASYIVTFRLNKARLIPAFCNAMLNTQLYKAKIKLLAMPSVSQANINPTTFRKELRISVPAIAEQQRIANCVSALDAGIAAEAEKLATLKTHKQGLMQQLFPWPGGD